MTDNPKEATMPEQESAQEDNATTAIVPMTPVESSQIIAIGYDEPVEQLFVKFKGGGIYRYDFVEKSRHDELMAAESKGRYFGKEIKGNSKRYPFTKIKGADNVEKQSKG